MHTKKSLLHFFICYPYTYSELIKLLVILFELTKNLPQIKFKKKSRMEITQNYQVNVYVDGYEIQ